MTAFALKLIALTAMLMDHAALVFPEIFPAWFRVIGRLAFPIFAYLVAEGFRKTSNRYKFLLRLGIFAVISQVPFALALNPVLPLSVDFFYKTNIFYTMFLGGVAIVMYEKIASRKLADTPFGQTTRQPLMFVATVIPMLIGVSIATDFGGLGVLIICMMYLIQHKKLQLTVLAVLISLLYILPLFTRGDFWLPFMFPWLAGGLASVLIIGTYNGKRGPGLKYLFYVIYPLHLALLGTAAVFLS